MATHNELGKQGEELAAKTLQKKGLRIIERNWKFAGYEVDIIATTKTQIVFVEVKTRSDDTIMNPEDAVDYNRQCRLTAAANAYVKYHQITLEPRFDVVAIVWNEQRCEVNHIEDAFFPTPRTRHNGNKRHR